MNSLRPIRIVVATPLGEGGRGGIDRMMDEVRTSLRVAPPTAVTVEFAVTRGQGSILTSPLHLARAIGAVARKPDLLHVNLSSHGSTLRKLVLCQAARLLGVPYLIHMHGSRFRWYWEQAPALLAGRIDSLFAHAERVLVLGTAWRDLVASRVPSAAERIEILPNATPVVTTDPMLRNATPTVLFLGHVGARKGVPQLVDALSELREENWQAIIAGNGDVEPTRQVIGERGLGDRIKLTGWVGPQDVASLLASSDILVLPSFDENLPMSVIEGMAYGLAVVTTPVGAVTDIVAHGETGLLVPPGDVPALKAALAGLLRDVGLRARLGKAAQLFHDEHLSIGPYVQRLVTIWRQGAEAGHRIAP
ncbi:glycosyltransferase family 4 protein [Xanthobacter autotrophicus]|uniref:glycosyltransferase family 4 protein n=1 Tax=Xanthobacter autotrophicus TaxID=280 RepID=UPI003728DC6E